MKYLILILLSFSAFADTTVELEGDLNIVGANQTAATVITYDQEGGTVSLCIGLSLNGPIGPGGGGSEVQTIDESTVNTPANFSFPESNVIERTVASSADGAYGLNSVVNTGYYYLEAEILEGSDFTTYFGVSYNTGSTLSAVFTHGIRLSDGMNRQNGGNGGIVTGWQPMAVGDSLRYWYKNGKIYYGQIINGVASVVGDPQAGTGHVYTLSPNADLRGAMVFGGINTKFKYKALTSNISADPLGATPLEDQN